MKIPVLLTHWDPGMYPGHPLPLIPELVINLLAYGHVVLKDVDLFMNERIVPYLTEDPGHWEAFASLIGTKRITVLTPDPSRGLDPTAPFFSAAQDHASRHTFAGQP